jgi:tetratricopeptide (TPR) repeat protein
MMKRAVLLAGLILLTALMVTAQTKGKGRINGLVSDEAGTPLEGVVVKLSSSRVPDGLEVKSDKEGKWGFSWLRSGGYTFVFDKIGYAPKTSSVYIEEGTPTPKMAISLRKFAGLIVTEEIRELLTKGNQLFEAKNYTEAVSTYEQILAKYPEAYAIYRNVGNCYFAQEKYDQAEEAYLKILVKEPENADAMIAIGNCYVNRGDMAKALEWHGKIDIGKLDDPTVLYNLGTSYYNSGKFEEALKVYRKSVEIQNDSTDALYQLGLTYLNLQKNAESIATFENYLKIDPDSPRAAQVQSFLDYLKKN